MSGRARHPRKLVHAGSFRVLESALWRELGEVRAAEPLAPIVVAVPTNLLRRHLTAEAAEQGGCINVHFLTLLDLARALGGPVLARAGRSPLPSLGGELLIRSLCRAMPSGYFSAITDRPGFHKAALATIEDFKEAAHAPADLERCLNAPQSRRSPLLPKLRDFAGIWSAYEARLAELRLHDQADLMAAAAAGAPEDRWLARAPALFIYGFYDLNELQRRLLAACAEGRRAAAFFPGDPEAEAFRYARPTFEWFVAQGFKPEAEPQPRPSDALDAFRRNLFEPGLRSPADLVSHAQQRVRIVSAPDEAREVRAILRAAAAAAREGTPLPRVGVLLRQTSDYAPLFAEECAAGGLEAYHHPLPRLSTTRAGRSFLMLLRLIGSDLSRLEVMDFITYADLQCEGTPPTADWDLLSRRAGIVREREEWATRLKALRKRFTEHSGDDDYDEDDEAETPARKAELREALDSLERFLGDFFPALEAVPKQGAWVAVVESVLAVFRRFVRQSCEREAVAEAVASLASLDATGETADVPTLARLAREALESKRPKPPPFGSRGPVVVDLMEGRGLPFDVVCVPGLAENGFPALPTPDPLLSDREREELAKAGLRLPRKSLRAEEERLLFRLAAGSATKALLLSYPRLEAVSDRERAPSHFLLRAVEALTGRRCDYAGLAGFPGHEAIAATAFAPADPQAAWCEAEYDLSAALAALRAKNGAELAYLAALAPTFASAWRAEESRWGTSRFTRYDGQITSRAALDALLEQLGRQPWRMRPTTMEEYAACPFKYFLRRILAIELPEEPEAVRRLSLLDRGTITHRILHRFMRQARDSQQLPLDAAAEQRMLDVAREEFAGFETLGLIGLRALWELDRAALELDLRRFVHKEINERDFLPAYFEVGFGTPPRAASAEPRSGQGLVLDLREAGKVEIIGRIDRIDLSPDRKLGRVVDYKTGKRKVKADALQGGTALQLPLYLKAAEMLLPGVEVQAAIYRFVTARGGYGEVSFSRQALAERQEELTQVIVTILDGIRQGRFFAGVVDPNDCKRCDYSGICGTFAAAAAERKKDDAAARAYIEMREVK